MIKPTDRDPRVNNRYAVPHPLVRARVGKTAHAYTRAHSRACYISNRLFT